VTKQENILYLVLLFGGLFLCSTLFGLLVLGENLTESICATAGGILFSALVVLFWSLFRNSKRR
jgi:hypothetical protein